MLSIDLATIKCINCMNDGSPSCQHIIDIRPKYHQPSVKMTIDEKIALLDCWIQMLKREGGNTPESDLYVRAILTLCD